VEFNGLGFYAVAASFFIFYFYQSYEVVAGLIIFWKCFVKQ